MKNKNLKKNLISLIVPIFLIVFCFIFVISNVSAIGMGPGKYAVDFSPGASQTLGYTALNNGDTPATYNTYVKGELAEYITCSPKSISLKAQERSGFSCIINMPSYLEPGPHQASVGIIESSPENVGQIAVLSAVESHLTVNVPYPDFYVAMEISVNNTKINEPTKINVKVKNWGKESANMQIPIQIMSGKEVVGNVMTDTKFIETMKEETFNIDWVANVADAGKYTAIANLVYNDKTFTASTSFLIGDLIINIVNLTSEMYPGEIGKFDLILQSMWSEPVDVNVGIEVLKDNISLGSKTEKFSINGFEEKDFKIFWDTPLQEAGKYQAKVKLNYNNTEKESLFNFEIKNRGESKIGIMAVVVGLVIIFVLIILAVLFFIRKGIMKKNRKKQKK